MQIAAPHRLRAQTVGFARDHHEGRHRDVGADHIGAGAVPHQRGFLRLGTDHVAGRVAQIQQRHVMRVAKLHETRRFVRRVAVDRPPEMQGIVGDDPHRPSLDAQQGGNHAKAESRADLQHRVRVGQRADQRAHVIGAHAVLRHGMAQQALIGAVPVLHTPLEVGEVLPRHPGRRGLVRNSDVHHAVGHLDGHRPDFLRPVDAEAAALDHRRTGHADGGVRGRDDDIAAAKQHRVAGEAAARGDADHRHQAAQPRELVERVAGAAKDRDGIGIAAAPAAAFGEDHRRQPPFLGEFVHPVLFPVVLLALRAGHDGVIVGARHDAAGFLGKSIAIDVRQTHDEAVGGGIVDQPFEGRGGAARGDGQRAIFDEGTGIDEGVEVLARGALTGRAAPRDRRRTGRVVCFRLPRQHFREIGTDQVEIDLPRRRRDAVRAAGFLDEQQGMALEDGIAGRDRHDPHDAAQGSGDLVLHLHGFHHQQGLAAAHARAFRDFQTDDGALHGRGDPRGAVRALNVRCEDVWCEEVWREEVWRGSGLLRRRIRPLASAGPIRRVLPQGDHGERIGGREPDTGGARRAGRGGRFKPQPRPRFPGARDQGADLLLDKTRMRLARQQDGMPQQRL